MGPPRAGRAAGDPRRFPAASGDRKRLRHRRAARTSGSWFDASTRVRWDVTGGSNSRAGTWHRSGICPTRPKPRKSPHLQPRPPRSHRMTDAPQNDTPIERDVMEYDVVTVGAGPSGLAFAIRLKQLNPEISVCVIEKSSTIGA